MSGSGNETFERDEEHARAQSDKRGESQQHKSTPEGTVRTQRGQANDIDPALLAHGHDVRDAPARKIVLVLAALAVFLTLAGGGVLLLLRIYPALEHPQRTTPLERVTLVPPPPRLERHEGEDRPALEAAARERLAGRGPDGAGMPIEEAMERLATTGWPDPDDGSRPPARPSDRVPAEARLPASRAEVAR